MELISAIAVGYADEQPKQRPRKKLEEILKWYEEPYPHKLWEKEIK